MTTPDVLVLGATGLIGRWLVPELTRQGRHVAVVVRRAAERADEYRAWTAAHNGDPSRLTVLDGDLTAPGLGLPADAPLADVRDVYNLGGRFAFGLAREEARRVNVDGALEVVRWTARLTAPRRLVHISGYRVGSSPVGDLDLLYRKLGAYEASKVEADGAVRREATALGVPFNIVNPSTVIGDSRTGETTQRIGLAALVLDLHQRRLPALPGSRDTWVPVITADHLARFLAAVPEHAKPGEALWALDESTPPLHTLLRQVAAHLDVPAPRLSVPAALLRRLPPRLTGTDPETLSFLSADRYPTTTATTLSEKASLTPPPLLPALNAWSTHLTTHP
ncbi:SDR family oxidoreductase [Actinocorallia sp. API 0066]|uniref:SDR family oxidoreductase n=1 Tax=Actinocorallia sp. API 0066 TaxID=2896846 RepID=UPI0021063C5C|nr:SDR family oxidoreductase [Actinocorallia sp. API 0066]